MERISSSERFPFTVEVLRDSLETSADSHITVRDAFDKTWGAGEGKVSVELPRGLYAVAIERAGSRTERVWRHEQRTAIQEREPARYSSVPASDTQNALAAFQDAA